MKSAVFQEYIIRIKISKVIFNLKGMKMFFFLIFDIITLESWEGVRIEKEKRKKTPKNLHLPIAHHMDSFIKMFFCHLGSLFL